MNISLVFCSGFTFAIGLINLIIGLRNKELKLYLYFGLLSLATSVFLLVQIPSIFNAEESRLSNTLSMVTASVFYGLIPWFCGEFTAYKKPAFQISIVAFIALLLFAYIMGMQWNELDFIWSIMAHLLIFAIGIYGFVAGLKSKSQISRIWLNIYLFLMISLALLAIVVGIDSVFAVEIIPDPEGFISPLDFFPVLFSVIIGYKISHDIIRSYQLETEVQLKDRQWERLMESINLLVVKLDLEGNVNWTNSHFLDVTGYKADEIIGANWFDKMFQGDAGKLGRQSFSDVAKGKKVPVYQNIMHIEDGSHKNIQWSNMYIQDGQDQVSGILSIGTDVTERESALAEIKHLKDQLEKENLLLKQEVNWQNHSSDIIGNSDALKYVLMRAHQVANTNSTVLLEGETGVGKELFANLIHQSSARKFKPFIKVNCASLPKELIESELFGHVKGSFTGAISNRQGRFELADKGTIFLDEIGELPLELQPKLLRVLQSGEFERIGSEKTKNVDVRVIAATNRNLEEEVSTRQFRQDLFFRLNVYPITIPPLRQRKEDIPILTKHFTKKIGSKVGKRIKHISKADMERLQQYEWPGNVRELENVLERAIINSENETIRLDDHQLISSIPGKSIENGTRTTEATLEVTQKNHIISMLEACNWKINGEEGAASKLGMPPSTLRSKMKKLEIKRPHKGN